MKDKVTLLVGVREVHVSKYQVEVDVRGLPEEALVLHRRNPDFRDRAIEATQKVLESGEPEAVSFEYSHTMEPHTWSLEWEEDGDE